MALFDCFKKKPQKMEEVLVPKLPEPLPQESHELSPDNGEYRPVTADDLKDFLRSYARQAPGYGVDPVLPLKMSRLTAKHFDQVRELPGASSNNPLILAMHALTTYFGKTDEVPWCAADVNWFLILCGFPGNGSAGAKDGISHGVANDDEWVEAGDIVGIQHPGWHITFAAERFNRKTAKTFKGFGGNQGNKLCEAVYNVADIRYVRRLVPQKEPKYPLVSGWKYDEMAKRQLRAHPELLSLVPADFWKFTGALRVDMAEFYNVLLAALCQFESNYNPSETYTEDFDDASGRKVISRGLLQISIESANSYGAGLTDPQQLHDPETNIRCAVLIMKRWLKEDGVIQGGGSGGWKGMSRYWSPFRKADRIAAIQKRVKAATKA